jgi:ribose transport system permease protein
MSGLKSDLPVQDGAPTSGAASWSDGQVAQRSRPFRVPESFALLLLLVVLTVFFTLKSPNFASFDNAVNILQALSVLGIIAAPSTLLLISGNLDLSVGATAAFVGVTFAVTAETMTLGTALAAALGAGLLVGLVNGFLVTVVGINSLITTLGTMAVLHGYAQVVAEGQTRLIDGFSALGTSRVAGVPLSVYLFVLIIALFTVVLKWTVYGRGMYAIGANPVAARLVGIRTNLYVFVGFVLAALAASLGGLILASQLSAASPTNAQGLEISVITAVVLGGTALHGGKGTLGGTVLGLLVIGVLNNGMVLLNVSAFYQTVAGGVLLILAVSVDQLRTRFGNRRRGTGLRSLRGTAAGAGEG